VHGSVLIHGAELKKELRGYGFKGEGVGEGEEKERSNGIAFCYGKGGGVWSQGRIWSGRWKGS